MKTVIVEARPSDATGQPVDIRLAGGGRSHYLFKDQSDWRAGVISLPRIQSSLGFGKDGFTGGAVAQASAIGFSPAMASTRALVAGLIWNDAAITVSVADDEAADPSFRVRLAGTVAGYSISAGRFVFTLSDMAGRLGEPLLKDSFAGTGGIEGDAAAKGRIKRRSWGRCWNVEGRVLLAAWNIYEFGDPARQLGAFDAVKDKGRPVTIVSVAWAGSIAATLDALKAVQVPEGGCAAAPSIACVKFWTQPSTLTADLRGELGTGYVEHVPGIAAAISAAAEGPGLDGLAALAALRPDPAGLHADDASETPAQMLDRLTLRASLSWGVTADRRMALRPIAFADPVETVAFEDVERRAAYAPVAGVKVGFQKNHRVHTDAEISAAVLAGDVVYPDGQKVADLQPAQAGADVTGQNTSADTKAVGGVPAPTVVLQLEKIEEIEPIKSDISAIALAQVGHAAELAVLDDARIDMEAIQRQVDRDAGKIDEALLRLLSEASRTREVLRDAGIVVDPATGVVRIYAVDQVAERTNRVEVGLDAVRGTVSLKADSNWVEEKIALAVLDPVETAQLEPIIKRLAKAEIEVDGLKGAITSKADVIELTRVGGRVTAAEQDIDAVKGTIALKLDKTVFDGLNATVQSIEQKLDTVGDTTSYSLNIRQARLIADDAATAALRGLLAGDAANQRQIVQAAQARQDIFTRLDGDKLTEAQARQTLAAEVGAVRTLAVSETTARITAVEAVARDVRSLGLTTDKQSAAIGAVNEAVLDGKTGLARSQTTIRQVVGRADSADEAILRALINGDNGSLARQAQIVQIQAELSTTLVANEASGAVARQALLARMNAAEAAIVDVQRVLADNVQSLVERIRASEAAWRDPETGLVATRSRLALEEKLSADRSQTNAKAIETLSSSFNDPATGLPAAFSAIGATRETAAKQNEATAKAVETLGSTVNNPDTGLPAAFATIGRVRDTAARENEATAKLVDQVKAAIDGVGNVGLQQAFEAVVDRLGKIEGRWSITIDANNNLSGIQLIGSTAGPASFNLINTDLKMGTGRVVFDNGKFMKVQGVGFGAAKDLIEWFGPTMTIDKCSRANALEYRTTTGDAYYGGSLSAGTLRNPGQSSSLAADAVAEVPLFGSNGKPVKYIASWSYYGEYTRDYAADNDGLKAFNTSVAAFNATSDDGGYVYFGSTKIEQPSSTIALSRAFAGGAYQQLDQRGFTTEQSTFRGLKPTPGDAPGRATFTQAIGGGFTVTDPVQSTANRTLRLTLSRGFNLSEGVVQRLNIVAIEE